MANPMIMNAKRVYEFDGEPMTIKGTITKTMFLGVIAFLFALITWNFVGVGLTDKAIGLSFLGAIGGFTCVMVSAFKRQYSKILSIAYACLEGLTLGAVSGMFEKSYPGIVGQAVLATFVTLFVMLFLYRTGLIKATEKFIKIIMTALISILVFYLIVFVAGFFQIQFLMPFVSAYNSPIVSLIIVSVAALSLIVDFANIEIFANEYAPKYMEWYFGMSLLVTIIWLYFEILRLLARSRK